MARMATKPTTAARRSSAEVKAERENILFAALAKAGDKRFERDQLEAGTRHEIDVTIAGEINGKPVDVPLIGALTIDHDQSRASSKAAPTDEVLALIIGAYVPEKDHAKLFATFAAVWPKRADHQGLDALKERCGELLKKLRDSETTTIRGTVRFTPAATEAA